MLTEGPIDAVIVATPTFTHYDIVMDALAAGKHVFCEKPPAMHAEQVQMCTDAASAAGLVLMYGMVCRFKPDVQALYSAIRRGELGRIYHAEAVRTKPITRLGGWFLDKAKAGGGELIDGCIHEIDMALYLMGYPKAVNVLAAWSHENADMADRLDDIPFDWQAADPHTKVNDVETMVSALVTFADGAALNIRAGRGMFLSHSDQRVVLLGAKAGAEIADGAVTVTNIDENRHFCTQVLRAEGQRDGFVLEFEHFADCCLQGTSCLCDNREVVQLMQIIDAIYLSAETGRAVRL